MCDREQDLASEIPNFLLRCVSGPVERIRQFVHDFCILVAIV